MPYFLCCLGSTAVEVEALISNRIQLNTKIFNQLNLTWFHINYVMPRSHQTRSQYVLQNVVERGQTVCERNERCDNCLESFCELNGRFMDAVDRIEREWHSRTSRLLKILRRPSRSEIWRSDNVLKARWMFYERNCRTSDLLGTHYNIVQSSTSYSTCARRPRTFLLRWSRSHTDPTRPYCDCNHFYSD